jgi:antirestriction protein ArdC
MGASYLKSYAGIPIEQLENNAAYIQSWLGRLKNDKRFIVNASSQAQKAMDYILNIKNEEKELIPDNEYSEKPEKYDKRERYEELKVSRQKKEIANKELFL